MPDATVTFNRLFVDVLNVIPDAEITVFITWTVPLPFAMTYHAPQLSAFESIANSNNLAPLFT